MNSISLCFPSIPAMEKLLVGYSTINVIKKEIVIYEIV